MTWLGLTLNASRGVTSQPLPAPPWLHSQRGLTIHNVVLKTSTVRLTWGQFHHIRYSNFLTLKPCMFLDLENVSPDFFWKLLLHSPPLWEKLSISSRQMTTFTVLKKVRCFVEIWTKCCFPSNIRHYCMIPSSKGHQGLLVDYGAYTLIMELIGW